MIISRLQEARRLEKATTARLLDAKKLSLIVDLDQTIVHATVDPTVGEWLQDPKNPNYKALEGVKRFKLADESPATRNKPKKYRKIRIKQVDPSKGEEADDESSEEEEDEDDGGCWYYIKMRCVPLLLLSRTFPHNASRRAGPACPISSSASLTCTRCTSTRWERVRTQARCVR